MIALFLLACSSAPDHAHEEVHAHEEGPRTVELSPAAMRSARIVVAPAEAGSLSRTLSLPARITLDPRREAIVSAWMAGQVDTLAVRPGESVRQGQRLAQVQSPELGTAVAAFRTAQARDQAADARLERLKRLEADGVSSRAQVLEAEADHAEAEGLLEAAEERLRILGIPLSFGDPHKGEHYPSRVPVRSPIAGTVLTANASVGERVEPGQALFRIGALDEVWLLLDVYERDLAAVSEGQSVQFSVEAWPGQTFEGPVAQVGDWIEPDARTVEVRVVVPNPEHRLKPNMFATARIDAAGSTGPEGVVVPPAAVQPLDGAEVVFVEAAPGRFEARPVEVEERSADRLRLRSGLVVGERVVTEGAFALRSELEKSELGEGHAH